MSKADSTQTPLSEEALQKHKSNRSPGHFRGYVILTTQRRFLIVVADPITIEEPDSPDLESKFLSSASTAPSIETDVPNRECCSNSKGIDTNSVLTNSIPHHELVSPARKPNLASHSRSQAREVTRADNALTFVLQHPIIVCGPQWKKGTSSNNIVSDLCSRQTIYH